MELIGTRKTLQEAFSYGWSRHGINMIEYMLYGEQIESGGFTDSGAMVCDGVEVGYILAAVDKQKPRVAQWIEFCYGMNHSDFRQYAVASDLFAKLFQGKIREKQITRYQNMCWIAAEDYRLRVLQNKQMPSTIYMQNMSVSDKNWARDWKEKKNNCLDELKNLDNDGVSNLSRIIRSLRGHSVDRPSEILASYEG